VQLCEGDPCFPDDPFFSDGIPSYRYRGKPQPDEAAAKRRLVQWRLAEPAELLAAGTVAYEWPRR